MNEIVSIWIKTGFHLLENKCDMISSNFVLRGFSKITSGFYEPLLHLSDVKNTNFSLVMILFFALPMHKILSLN